MLEFNKRTFTYKQFCRVMDLAMYSVTKNHKYFKTISKEFRNHIMLAVTEVNGCQACSWFHTKEAIKMKMSNQDINSLLSRKIKNLPDEEHTALLFAQHYADTFGNYDQELYQGLINEYGEKRAKGILVSIRMIMLGNVNGIAFGCLKERVKGKPVKTSKLRYELLSIFGVIWVMPYYIFKNLFKRKNV